MARSRSSGRWLSEHFSDEYVKQAQAQGYRSRAVYKLKELDQRDRLFKPGMSIVDLGAAPGSWSQYAAERTGKKGRIIAVDLLPMEAMDRVTFIQGDFRETPVLSELKQALGDLGADLLLSDMAPNSTGARAVDQSRSMYLAELALETAVELVKPGGALVVKLFQGPDFDSFVRSARNLFGKVAVRKPKASRDRSPEVYLVGLERKA
jgi:23S rRNA (uridine2552-2'-O)-methyltransferase